MVFETVRALLAQQFGDSEESITPVSTFEELEMQMSELQETMLLLDQEFDLQWTQEELSKLETVADLTDFVENQL